MSERVLVPLDESDQAWRALEHVLETHPDAAVTALHVLNPAEWVSTASAETGGYYSPELAETAETRAEDLLARAEDAAADRGVALETTTVTGRPIRAIVEYVEDHEIDHVVMGSRGRSGLSRVLLGSVAEAVLRRSPVPVTVVR